MGRKRNTRGRRRLLRLGAALVVGGPLVGRLAAAECADDAAPSRGAKPEIAVLADCTGCTGCVAVCPTEAIVVVAGKIEVTGDLCIHCGYCQAACPVNGIAVRRSHEG